MFSHLLSIEIHLYERTTFFLDRFDMSLYNFILSLQEDICIHSNATVENVTNCPGNATAIKERSEKKRCDVYQHCQDKQLVYHCTRYDKKLVEVCAPKQNITGKCLTMTWILKDFDWLLQNDRPHVLKILQFQLIVLLAILSVCVCVKFLIFCMENM